MDARQPLESARILIVDDEPANVQLLERILRRGGFTNLLGISDARRVLAVHSEFGPDLVMLDLHMPYLDGFMVMDQIVRRGDPAAFDPILVLTADVRREVKERALSAGAKDFLTKPVDATEVLLRVRNLLETRALQQSVRDQNRVLEERVQERTRELSEAYLDTVQRLARAGEYRDDVTGSHAQRVGETAGLLALALGMPEDEVKLIRNAAPLHDIGKIGIPDSILQNEGPLTPEEFEEMKNHTTIGVGILSGSRSGVLQLAEEIALYHHERWDGGGYMGLKGTAIPLSARIVSVSDALDALTHGRPYRTADTVDDALTEIERESGKQFDPRVVQALLRLYGDRSGRPEGAPASSGGSRGPGEPRHSAGATSGSPRPDAPERPGEAVP
jgi:putative two-component system response regulator